MNDAFYAHLARENNESWLARRLAKADALLERLTRPQRAVVDDPSEYKAVVTPGQAGKTTLSKVLMARAMLMRRQPLVAYVSLTQKVAKRYLWEQFNQLNNEFDLGLEPHNTDGCFRSPDGGELWFGGIESAADVERYRGSPWDLFILDETKSADQKLVQILVDDVLPPRLNNRRGTLLAEGTPGAILHGKFWQISDWKGGACSITDGPNGPTAISRPWWERDLPKWQGVNWQWSLHRWSLAENTARRDLWELAQALKIKRGWSDDNPIWLREFMGEWVADATNRLYRYNPKTCLWKPDPKSRELFGLPAGHDWYFVIGVDFGYSDPFCIETLAFSDTHEDLFQVWEYHKRGLTLREQATMIRRAQDLCGERLFATVGDPAKRHILESLLRDHQVLVEAAEKREKRDAVELVSSDFFEGRFKLLEDTKYAEQAASLQWDETGLREPSGVENDASDAGLYAHRKAQHRIAQRPTLPPAPGTPEYEAEQDAAELEAIGRNARAWHETDDDDDDLFGQVFDEGNGDSW